MDVQKGEVLPDVLLCKIFGLLNLRELGVVCEVNLQWNSVSLHQELWTPQIDRLSALHFCALKRFQYDRNPSKKELFHHMNSSLQNQKRAQNYLRTSFSIARETVAPVSSHMNIHTADVPLIRWRRSRLLVSVLANLCWWFSLLLFFGVGISSSGCTEHLADGWLMVILVQDVIFLICFLCLGISIRCRTVAQLVALSDAKTLMQTRNPVGQGLKTVFMCFALGAVTSILQLARPGSSSNADKCELTESRPHSILVLVGIALNFLLLDVARRFEPQRPPIPETTNASRTRGDLDESFLL